MADTRKLLSQEERDIDKSNYFGLTPIDFDYIFDQHNIYGKKHHGEDEKGNQNAQGDEIIQIENERESKSLKRLIEWGGIKAVVNKIKVNIDTGLMPESGKEDMEIRYQVFGINERQTVPPKGLCFFVKEALEDTILRILILSAIISLTLGMIVEPDHGWIEGTAILSAVIIVVTVSAGNNVVKENQFRQLWEKSDQKDVTVRRDGKEQQINVFKLYVGDIILLRPGESVPVDGLIFHSVKCQVDESSATGESNLVKKTHDLSIENACPFLISGTKIQEGECHMIACAVGKKSFSGKNMELLIAKDEEASEATPLQKKLERVAEHIGYIGLFAAVLTLLVLYGRFFIGKMWIQGIEWDSKYLVDLMEYTIIGVIVIVVAVPEGLPLAVTLCLAFSVSQMKKDNNLVRHLAACEIMGGADNICSDKTGTLTQNKMTVVKAWIDSKEFDKPLIKVNEFKAQLTQISAILSEGIILNSDAYFNTVKGQEVPIGNQTECALLNLARLWHPNDYIEFRKKSKMLNRFPFDSKVKRMSTQVQNQDKAISYVKGQAKQVLSLCDKIIGLDGQIKVLSQELKDQIVNKIKDYSEVSLRTLAIAFRDLDFIPNEETPEDLVTKELVLVGIVGIEDAVRPGVPEIIQKIQNLSKITVRMVTGDQLETAVSIAKQCNILSGDPMPGEVMEGPKFQEKLGNELVFDENKKPRVKNVEALKEVALKLRVLASSSPYHKYMLVVGLMQLGHTVAVTGDGTNDAPALRASDVGFAMNISGTDVAKTASDIIMVNDEFQCIVEAVKWGRNIYDNIRKFLQFQLTINIVAIFMTFCGAAIFEEAPMTAVQMLWVNLIMDSFAALALATEPPTEELLDRAPYKKTEYIITPMMWKNLLGAAIYQITILFIILFLGPDIFGVPQSMGVGLKWDYENGKLLTIFFHTFVLMQVFNEINCRKLKDEEKNVFSGLFRNWYFLGIVGGTFFFQIIIVQFGGFAAKCSPLSLEQHIICICIGMTSIVWGFIVRHIPASICRCCKFDDTPTSNNDNNAPLVTSLRRKTLSGISQSKIKKQ